MTTVGQRLGKMVITGDVKFATGSYGYMSATEIVVRGTMMEDIMAIDEEFSEELERFINVHDEGSGYIRNLLLFRLCKAVEALKVERVEPVAIDEKYTDPLESRRQH